MIVEAKNENIIGGLGQCIVGMFAARLFNKQENGDTALKIYGVVTCGTTWKFLTMVVDSVYIDLDDYAIVTYDKIMGILLEMATQKA